MSAGEAMTRPPFHLAVAVTDLEASRRFYCELLGCRVGRSAERWIDLDFFGHQVSLHRVDEPIAEGPTNRVDGKDVPVRHFGAVLEWTAWHELARFLEAEGAEFLIPPGLRFEGQVGEQATLFLLDPSGNAIELKSFRDPDCLFASDPPAGA